MTSPFLCCGRSESNTFESPGPVVVPGRMSQDFRLQVTEINLIASLKQKGMRHSLIPTAWPRLSVRRPSSQNEDSLVGGLFEGNKPIAVL